MDCAPQVFGDTNFSNSLKILAFPDVFRTVHPLLNSSQHLTGATKAPVAPKNGRDCLYPGLFSFLPLMAEVKLCRELLEPERDALSVLIAGEV